MYTVSCDFEIFSERLLVTTDFENAIGDGFDSHIYPDLSHASEVRQCSYSFEACFSSCLDQFVTKCLNSTNIDSLAGLA